MSGRCGAAETPNTCNMWSGIITVKHSTVGGHVRNDVLLQNFVSISDARHYIVICTRAVLTPWLIPATTRSVDLLHAVWSVTLPSMSVDTRASISTCHEKTRHTWKQNSSPPGPCPSRPLLVPMQTLSDVRSQIYVALVF